ncbi:MAG: hypothetical protein HYV45_00135 [Candidatus Moranbacteria bacterium]|nr:hypothetical protein [Candidatus Moranbacteria bacterium]
MTTQSITQDQEKQLKRFLEDASVSATRSALAQVPLDKEGAQQVIERGDALKAEIERATINALKRLGSRYPVLTETRLLKPVAQATVPARTKPFNVAEFYQTGPGLYVYDTFADRLDLHARQAVDSAPERPYVASLLKANAYDKDIRKELPETHLSTLEDIAGLIEAQPNGKSGFLLNNGYANIFYVEGKNGEVFAVDVYWGSDDREWDVGGWELDEDGHWDADFQVLCPGNAAL